MRMLATRIMAADVVACKENMIHDRLIIMRGNLYVCGPTVEAIASRYLERVPLEHRLRRQERDGGRKHHITILLSNEFSDAKSNTIVSEWLAKNPSIDFELIAFGLGRVENGVSEAWFVVVKSPVLQQLHDAVVGAKSVIPRDFHITLGFSKHDIHAKPKGLRTCLPPHAELSVAEVKSLLAWSSRCTATDGGLEEVIECLEFVARESQNKPNRLANVLDALSAIHMTRDDSSSALSVSDQLVEVDRVRGLVRRCVALKGLRRDVESNFAGLEALCMLWRRGRSEDQKAIDYVKSLLCSLDCPIDSRCLVADSHSGLMEASSIWGKLDGEQTAWLVGKIASEFTIDQQLRWESKATSATERRCVLSLDGNAIGMPRHLSWVIPQRLCGMSTPRNPQDVRVLSRSLNVRLVVSLTRESPLPEEWFDDAGCAHAFFPVDNYMPPSMAQVDEFMAMSWAVMSRGPGAVLVHCGGGKGRAGTFLACWLVRFGLTVPMSSNDDDIGGPSCMACCTAGSGSIARGAVFCETDGCCFSRASMLRRSWCPSIAAADRHRRTMGPNEAVEYVRRSRPGSIETEQQKRFVHEYASELWRRAAFSPQELAELPPQASSSSHVALDYDPAPRWNASTAPLHVSRGSIKGSSVPSLVVACGLPGSGKSTLGAALRANGRCAHVLSGDELGGQGLERALGRAIKAKGAVYVDRCNADRESRARVLAAAFRPADAVAVFLDMDREECMARVAARVDHPTIECGSGRSIVASFARRLVPPECSEGFARVYIVASQRALDELMRLWGCKDIKADDASSSSNAKPTNKDEDQHHRRLANFTKFPRTPHLVRMSESSVSRDDLLVSKSAAEWLRSRTSIITVEEKIDGANLGLSVDPETWQIRAQNRSHFVSSGDHPQFGPLSSWLAAHQAEIRAVLDAAAESFATREGRTVAVPVIFGEWTVARHSIGYDDLPDYFVAFDILLPNGRFASRRLFHDLLRQHAPSIRTVPCLMDSSQGPIALNALTDIVTKGVSRFIQGGKGRLEGVYVRVDEGDFLRERAKIVRADFIAGNEHWSRRSIERNGLRRDHPS